MWGFNMGLHDPDRPDNPGDYSRRAVQHRGVWHILPQFQLLRESGGFVRPQYHTLCGRKYFAIKPDRHLDRVEGENICAACLTIYKNTDDVDERIFKNYGN